MTRMCERSVGVSRVSAGLPEMLAEMLAEMPLYGRAIDANDSKPWHLNPKPNQIECSILYSNLLSSVRLGFG